MIFILIFHITEIHHIHCKTSRGVENNWSYKLIIVRKKLYLFYPDELKKTQAQFCTDFAYLFK